jgi:hypothetical protein
METFRVAAAEDVTAALCALDGVTKSFAASIDDLTRRTVMLEESAAEIERCAPLLRLIEEPPPQGLRVSPFRARLFWAVAAILCLLAAAAGFIASRYPAALTR